MSIEAERQAQREAALREANKRRKQMKEVRLALKHGELDPFEVLEGTAHPVVERVVQRLTLGQLLPMIPGVGKARAHEIIEAFQGSPRTRLAALTEQRRRELSLITKGAREAYVVPRVYPREE